VLVATLPTVKRRQFVAVGDVGLVTDRSAYEIAEAALLTGAYAKQAYSIKREARIGLLSNGSEPGKGSKDVVEADELLQALNLPSYLRNVEPQQIFDGHVDAVGKDGFVGNTSLKWIEATAKLIKKIQEEEVMNDPLPLRILNWIINRSKWRRMKKRLTAEDNAAAPFVGLPKMVYKVHGSADSATFAAAILQAAKLQERNIIEDIRTDVLPSIEKLRQRT
jgi:phosphate acyltransferase